MPFRTAQTRDRDHRVRLGFIRSARILDDQHDNPKKPRCRRRRGKCQCQPHRQMHPEVIGVGLFGATAHEQDREFTDEGLLGTTEGSSTMNVTGTDDEALDDIAEGSPASEPNYYRRENRRMLDMHDDGTVPMLLSDDRGSYRRLCWWVQAIVSRGGNISQLVAGDALRFRTLRSGKTIANPINGSDLTLFNVWFPSRLK
ncbi:hypothetical protein FQN50_006122 [Emmonsiellopsis sp. PD_5]|nr:hypothetical protein FQN50_006122 [Emmonsiellopsis sp. PD_5]